MVIKKVLFGTTLTVEVQKIGKDIHLLLYGGEKPHLGCTVLALPRQSLDAGNPHGSSTASVLNVTGHKDETLCRFLAETVAAKKQAVTVCSGGFHMDTITPDQIQKVEEAVQAVAKEVVASF